MYKIEEQENYPAGRTRYVVVHPDDVERTGISLIHRITPYFRDISVHYKTTTVNGQQAALLWSGNPKFYFGINESTAVPSYSTLIDVDMAQTEPDSVTQRALAHYVPATLARRAAMKTPRTPGTP